jgi:CRP-like cAMP-binding protein
VRTYDRNELLFNQGDAASEMFVVVTGRIAIATKAPDGRESVVAVLEDGGLIGEMGLFDGAARSADARALVESRLLVLDYESVRHALEAHPDVLWVAVRLLARRLRATDEALADAVFLDVPGRTAKRLLELAGDADEFKLPVTQEELAAMVGASRERVNKALALFSRLGWIEVQGRGRYKFLDRASLEDRATL